MEPPILASCKETQGNIDEEHPSICGSFSVATVAFPHLFVSRDYQPTIVFVFFGKKQLRRSPLVVPWAPFGKSPRYLLIPELLRFASAADLLAKLNAMEGYKAAIFLNRSVHGWCRHPMEYMI